MRSRLLQSIEAPDICLTRLDFVADRASDEFVDSIQALHGPGFVLRIETEAGKKRVLCVRRPVLAVLISFDMPALTASLPPLRSSTNCNHRFVSAWASSLAGSRSMAASISAKSCCQPCIDFSWVSAERVLAGRYVPSRPRLVRCSTSAWSSLVAAYQSPR